MRTLSKRNRQDRNAKMDLLSMRNRHKLRSSDVRRWWTFWHKINGNLSEICLKQYLKLIFYYFVIRRA